jgi:hypothetical protein
MVAVGLAMLLGGCSAGGTGTRCESTTDCTASGRVCTDGQCRACGSDEECAPYGEGSACRDGVCADCEHLDGGCGCSPGQLGCACRDTGSACGLGLACVEGTCAECPDGARECACRTSGDACDPSLACEDRRCTDCELGSEGCDCDAGGCGAGLICAADHHCRSPASCEALRAAGLCPEGHACTLVDGSPTCLDECEPGFRLEDGACVDCGPDGCVTASCDDLDCASVHRTCEVAGGAPACAGCEAGFREDETLRCVDERLCGGSLCPDGEMAVHGSDGGCACVPTPCPSGHARNAEGTCVACSITCGGVEGETGSLHPLASGLACMCETRDGYFVPPGEDGRARRCDDDGDGWIGATALAAEQSPELAISSNARCTIRRAARVDLVNEYGQTLELRPCGDGLVADREGRGPDLCNDLGTLEPIVLVEPDRNDREDELAAEAAGPLASAPPYGTGRFRAEDLNALTRACSTEHADYDADGRADIAESQTAPAAALDNDDRLNALSFFAELHTASFVAGTGDGVLVITERMRCATGFPLAYGTLDGGSTYWRGCHRQRDARFGRPTAPPGLDFAAFSCDAPSGTCEVPIPSTGRARTECPGGGACHETAPHHDACEAVTGGWGAEWRGMHHHSQFRCVLVDGASSSPYAEPPSAIGASGHLAFSRCSIDDTGGFSCAASATTGVGWAAVRFTPSVEIPAGDLITDTAPVTEVLGCIDEARATFAGNRWSSALCPSPDDPAIALAHDFGRLDCPCQPSETLCADGLDDDCDGLVDCADPDCDADTCGPHGLVCGASACMCPGGTTETTCGDGGDNDCDGALDCDDASCGGRSCGVNGRICIGGSCQCPGSSESCNGDDDDCDGVVDDGCPNALTPNTTLSNLALFGGGGGGDFDRTCPPGEALVGANLRSGTVLDQIAPRCARLRLVADTSRTPDFGYDVVWDTSYALSPAGGGGGSPSTLQCPNDQIATGITGASGIRVDRIAFQCSSVSLVRSGGGWAPVVTFRGLTASAGGGGGGAFTSSCSGGRILRGLRGRAGDAIDAIGGRCAPVTFSSF